MDDARSRVTIEYYLGVDPPRAWQTEAGMVRKTPPDRVLKFRVENVGAREESLSDAYISLPGGGEVRPFSAGMPAIPSQLKPGFPIVFGQALKGVAQALVNEGCTGTARVKFVARLGRGDLHRKRVEVPNVEDEARR